MRRTLIASLTLTLGALAACGGPPEESNTLASAPAMLQPPIPEPALEPAFAAGKPLALDSPVVVKATGSKLIKVTATDGEKNPLAGEISEDGLSWKATDTLASGGKYSLKAEATDIKGETKTLESKFQAEELPLDRLSYATVSPAKDAKVGVAMPVVVKFDVPVKDRAAFEKRMKVTSTPPQAGAFSWLSDNEVRWRPKDYWKPGTKVNVDVDVKSVPAGNGVYGQYNVSSNFTVGRKQVVKVDMNSHRMKVFRDGEQIKDLATSTGLPKYSTRSGTKVIMERFRYVDMNSASVGIDPNSADGYDLSNVEYAMRLTNSGEFIHAAPWNAAFLGNSNQSHGCTGLTVADARWLFDNTMIGDPVEYSEGNREMTRDNGYGDWNVSWNEWSKGSAL